jgi:hypothetical protein
VFFVAILSADLPLRSGGQLSFGVSGSMRLDPLRQDWHRLCDRWSQSGYESLNDTEKLWLNIQGLIDSINNGGLISYFYNSYAERYADCVAALEHLKEFEILRQVQRLGTLFGSPVPTSIERRNEIINAWPDYGYEHDVCEATDEVLMPLMKPLDQKLAQYLMERGYGS